MQRLRRSFLAFLTILGASVAAAFLVNPGKLELGWILMGVAVGLLTWALGVFWGRIRGKIRKAIYV